MLLHELYAVGRFYYADDLLLTFLREKKKLYDRLQFL